MKFLVGMNLEKLEYNIVDTTNFSVCTLGIEELIKDIKQYDEYVNIELDSTEQDIVAVGCKEILDYNNTETMTILGRDTDNTLIVSDYYGRIFNELEDYINDGSSLIYSTEYYDKMNAYFTYSDLPVIERNTDIAIKAKQFNNKAKVLGYCTLNVGEINGKGVLMKCREDGNQVIIPKFINELYNSCLCGLDVDIEELKLGDNVEKIGRLALSETKVKRVIANGVKELGDGCFMRTYKLKEVVLGDGLETIPNFAFSRSYIHKINIPKNVRVIGKSSFERTKIKEIMIPDSVDTIYKDVFFGSDLKILKLPKSLYNKYGQDAEWFNGIAEDMQIVYY